MRYFLPIYAILIERPIIKLVKSNDKVKSTQGGVSDIDMTFIPFQNNFYRLLSNSTLMYGGII